MPVLALASHKAAAALKAVMPLKISSHWTLRPNLRNQDVTSASLRNRRMVTVLTAGAGSPSKT
ncbi:hypothetical protein V7798_32280 [Rhizobium laguerreae]